MEDSTKCSASEATASTQAKDETTSSVTTTTPPSEPSLTDSAASKGSSTTANAPLLTVDQARWQLEESQKKQNGAHESDALLFESIQLVLQDHDVLKDKVGKLKSLLGRSAKAQREAKVELDATQKKLLDAVSEKERLTQKIEKLSNRPTHMELLADFEANFDRALLSVGKQHNQQSGGEDTAPAMLEAAGPAVDHLVVQELAETKQRLEKLEKLNSTLASRATRMEGTLSEQTKLNEDLNQKVAHLELEKRMAQMEASDALKQLQHKAAELEDMKMELEMVTQASVRANAKAAAGEELRKKEKAERQHLQQLEGKVQVLQEWALASSEAKTLAQERVRVLEQQLRSMQRGNTAENEIGDAANSNRLLLDDQGSFVIGAGEVGFRVFALTMDQVKSVRLSERVVLQWHFDLTSSDAEVPFSVMRGTCETTASRKAADCIVKNRAVKGGAEGQIDDAFTSQRSCTMEWDNSGSWIYPKTVKYQVKAIVVADEDST